MTPTRTRGRLRCAALLPLLLMVLLPLCAADGLAKEDKSLLEPLAGQSRATKSKAVKAWNRAESGPRNWGDVASGLARRGGGHASSDPTTIPVVDGDFLWMAEITRGQVLARPAQRIARGGGVLVAVLDGGFDLDHPDIAGHTLAWGYDAIDGDFDPQDEGNGRDDDWDGLLDSGVGHGTFVAGMVLFAAPDATILPVRVYDDEGLGTDDEMLRGLRFAFEMGAQVVNISGETPHGGSQQVRKQIALMRSAGVVVVNSAGNEGLQDVSALAFPNDSLTVGAVDWTDRVADFSNVTYDPGRFHVYAPGVDLYGPLGIGFSGSRGYWSGTSFSTGLVSGAAALLRGQDPALPATEVMRRLSEAVDPAFGPDGLPMPHGRIDLWKVVYP